MNNKALTNKHPIFGSAMLIAGCCIGAGMIGLPVVSALAGFMPSMLAMFLCYLFTTATGLLLVEATLWFEHQVNLPSIVEFALGKTGKVITIILFLSLFYCLFVAYLDAGGTLFAELLGGIFKYHIPHALGVIACVWFIFAIAYAGTRIVDKFNRGMLIGLVVSYFLLVFVGMQSVHKENLLYSNWESVFGVVPVLLICFGYHNLVPSITYYLEKNVKAIRFSIIIGNLIPFLVYFVWNYVILGMLPSMSRGGDAELVVQLLQGSAVSSISIILFVKSFSMFAMLTSFLPSAVSFADFIKDGFNKVFHQEKNNEILVYGLVLIPPTICALIYPRIFLHALSFAGGFIDVLLFGVLPATVILLGRRIRRGDSIASYQVFGGSVTPMIILILSITMLVFKFIH